MTNPNITCVLAAIEAGDSSATEELLPLVYEELRQMASQKMHREKASHTLQPTALVHEAFLRLIGGDDAGSWDSRAHFFAAAAEAMRRILIESARRRSAEKRGGDRIREPLQPGDAVACPEDDQTLLELDDALTKLASADPKLAQMVQLRYFAGLTIDQTAEMLGCSSRTVKRNWTYAKAWLQREMQNPS
ncbi:MAG: sigma-70 family RNA polymerase sigma factor [Planctomycetota bacterium]